MQNSNNQSIQKSKSVVFDDSVLENASPLKLTKHRSNGPLVTPTKKRSTNKAYYAAMGDEDEENDAIMACSSGKNSRRKLSVVRNQVFEANFEGRSQSRMCMDAPRKSNERPANARYL